MGDGNSVSGTLADLAKETVKQAVKMPVSIAKGAGQQIVGKDSEEEEARKRAEKTATFNRIKAIEAEMVQIRRIEEQKQQQRQQQQVSTPSQRTTFETNANGKKLDEASRQAVGRAEQGRNFKG